MTGATGEARTLNDAVGRHDFIQVDYGRRDIKLYKNYGLKQCSQPLRYPVWVYIWVYKTYTLQYINLKLHL